jgi:hypothetical protein
LQRNISCGRAKSRRSRKCRCRQQQRPIFTHSVCPLGLPRPGCRLRVK